MHSGYSPRDPGDGFRSAIGKPPVLQPPNMTAHTERFWRPHRKVSASQNAPTSHFAQTSLPRGWFPATGHATASRAWSTVSVRGAVSTISLPPMSRTTALRLVLSSGVRRVGDALSPIKILLGDDPVLDRPDQERHVARQVREVVLAPVALLESLEMHERMVPGVNEEILA